MSDAAVSLTFDGSMLCVIVCTKVPVSSRTGMLAVKSSLAPELTDVEDAVRSTPPGTDAWATEGTTMPAATTEMAATTLTARASRRPEGTGNLRRHKEARPSGPS